MKDRFRNNHNRAISIGDKPYNNTRLPVAILGFDDLMPIGKYKGTKIIDIINQDNSSMAYALKKHICIFSKAVGDDIKKRQSDYFASKYTYEQRKEFFDRAIEKRKAFKPKTKTPKAIKLPKPRINPITGL